MEPVNRDPGRQVWEGPTRRVAGRRRRGPAVPELGLALGGALTSGMALYHFYLPYAFHWGDALTGAPVLRWGLTIINGSFSYLLLAGGVITTVIGLKPALKGRVGRMVIGALAGYWLLNGAFQVLLPMPLPRALAPLRWVFLGFSLSVTLLYLSALVPGKKDEAPSDSAPPPLRILERESDAEPGSEPGVT